MPSLIDPREFIKAMIPGVTTFRHDRMEGRWKVVSTGKLFMDGEIEVDNSRGNKMLVEQVDSPHKRQVICFDTMGNWLSDEQVQAYDLQPPVNLRAFVARYDPIWGHDNCRGCGRPLFLRNVTVADGCPCNAARGINHGLVPSYTCTCAVCDPRQTGGTRKPVSFAVNQPI